MGFVLVVIFILVIERLIMLITVDVRGESGESVHNRHRKSTLLVGGASFIFFPHYYTPN